MVIETKKTAPSQTEEGGGGGREIIPESDSQTDDADSCPTPNTDSSSDNNPGT